MTKVNPTKFEVGDVVRLKSGGPPMTVEVPGNPYTGLTETVCVTPDGVVIRGEFPPCILVKQEYDPDHGWRQSE